MTQNVAVEHGTVVAGPSSRIQRQGFHRLSSQAVAMVHKSPNAIHDVRQLKLSGRTARRHMQRARSVVVEAAIKKSSEKNVVSSKTLTCKPGMERKVMQVGHCR